MYRLANARTALSQRNEPAAVLIREVIAATFIRKHTRSRILLLGGAIALIATSAFAQTQAASAGDPADLDALSRDPNQWVMAPRDYASTRFSGLDQINTGDAAQLRVGWTFSLGADRGQEAAPLIVNNTMYVVGPYAGPHPNQVFALDATTGDLKWSYGYCQLKRPWYPRRVGGAAARVGELLCSPIMLPRSAERGRRKAPWVR